MHRTQPLLLLRRSAPGSLLQRRQQRLIRSRCAVSSLLVTRIPRENASRPGNETFLHLRCCGLSTSSSSDPPKESKEEEQCSSMEVTETNDTMKKQENATEVASSSAAANTVDEYDDEEEEYDPSKPPTVRLYPVYSRFDIEDLLQNDDPAVANEETFARDAAVALTCPLTLSELHRICKECFGTLQDVQYHNGTTWAPLLNEDDVTALRTSLERHPRGFWRIIPIQVPQYFDAHGLSGRADEDDDEEEEETPSEERARMPPPEPTDLDERAVRLDRGLVHMAQMVDTLLAQLHASPWEICDDPQQLLRFKVDPNVTISTRKWILDLAEQEEEETNDDDKNTYSLRQLIYLYPGAIEHMANCIHMLDALPPLPRDDDESDGKDAAKQKADL